MINIINIIKKINTNKKKDKIYYSPMFGDIKFVQIKNNIIECVSLRGKASFLFDEYGRYLSEKGQRVILKNKCSLFPDSEKNWEKYK
ncbi:MAG: hypothetical protein IJV31_07045 [Clostridia bacterium]|nr:hypothetical protein [Clostridia bacterium]MBR1718752.1 hypothetical protein [Bacilli bacterium]